MYIADILGSVIASEREREREREREGLVGFKWNTVEIFYRGLLWNCFKLKDFPITTLEKTTSGHNKVPNLKKPTWNFQTFWHLSGTHYDLDLDLNGFILF